MITDLVSIAAVPVLCVGWVLFQRWIARMDAELPGIQRSCSGCPVPGAKGASCGTGACAAPAAGSDRS
jgi:hypothetical protein